MIMSEEQKRCKRIFIITDSMGCPRKETPINKTWVDRIIAKYANQNVHFYTYCLYGLSISQIKAQYFCNFSPDLIIMQIGIVDACRRALSKKELQFVEKLSFLSKYVNIFCRNKHYKITKLRNIHYSNIDKFQYGIKKLSEITKAKFINVSIAPPGKTLVDKVYNVINDIEIYNKIISDMPNSIFLNPYDIDGVIDYFLLDDGYHLNINGQELVYNAVDNVLETILEDWSYRCDHK